MQVMEMNFCRRCGTKLALVKDHIFECESGHTIFANSSPCVGLMIVTKDDQLLMAVRNVEPHKGTLDLIGGFLDQGETFEEAIYRELHEEANLMPDDISPPAYLMTAVNGYSYGNENIPVVSPIFWCRLTSDKIPKPQDDVADFIACSFEELNDKDLYPGDILTASRKLRNILEQ